MSHIDTNPAAAPVANRLNRSLRPEFHTVLKYSLAFILLVLVIVPIGFLIRTSLTDMSGPATGTMTYTLQNFVDAVFDPALVRVTKNTLIFAGGSTVLGISIAFGLAWLTERTDMPGGLLVRVFMFSWMAVPPLVFGYGWVLALNPNNGMITNLLVNAFGMQRSAITPYSMSGLIVIAGLGLVPTSFVMLSALLQKMDPSLEDAGLMSGAARRTVFRRITVPLLTPGLLSVGLFLSMAMVQTLDLPLIIGATAQLPMLSTRTFQLAFPEFGAPRLGLAAAYGVVLLVFALALMLVYFRMTHTAERFRVISGKGFRPKRARLNLFQKIAALAVVGSYFALMFVPLGLLAWGSLLPFYQVPSVAALESVSLARYAAMVNDPFIHRAIRNTLVLMFSSALIVMTLSLLIAWLVARHPGRLSKTLDATAFSVIAVPSVVMGLAILIMYLRTPLQGTIALMVIGHSAIYLAFGTRTMAGALVQMHKDLEGAATMSGASQLMVLRRIVVPLMWPQIIGGWLWVVAHSARDLSLPLILTTNKTVVAASAIRQLWEEPYLPMAAALSITLVLMLLVLVLPVELAMRRRRRMEA